MQPGCKPDLSVDWNSLTPFPEWPGLPEPGDALLRRVSHVPNVINAVPPSLYETDCRGGNWTFSLILKAPSLHVVQVSVLREALEDCKGLEFLNFFTFSLPKIVLNDRTIHVKHDFTSGVNVENAAHPCVGGPCTHGGSCRPRKEGYECDCPLGFEGLHCQKGTCGGLGHGFQKQGDGQIVGGLSLLREELYWLFLSMISITY